MKAVSSPQRASQRSMLTSIVVAVLCLGCMEPLQPSLRFDLPIPAIEAGVSDGCARFQVVFDSGGTPAVQSIYNTSYCQTNDIELSSDSATFDAGTGTLRIRVRIRNQGVAVIVPRVRMRFNADSAKRLDASGETVPGLSNIVGYQPDSAGSNGRQAFWWFDQVLAPSGQPQILLPNAQSAPRWIEVRGSTWTAKVRLKLALVGAEATVPATPPDSTPAFVYDSTRVNSLPNSQLRFVRDLLVVQFSSSASQLQKDSALAALQGTVVGGKPGAVEGGGFYYVLLPADASNARLRAAEQSAVGSAVVRRAVRYVLFPASTSYQYPADGTNWQRADWRADTIGIFGSAALRGNWGLRAVRFPLAWGCSTGESGTPVRVGVLDLGFRAGVADLTANTLSSRNADMIGDTAMAHGNMVAAVLAARGNCPGSAGM